jgi:hypothetical protein
VAHFILRVPSQFPRCGGAGARRADSQHWAAALALAGVLLAVPFALGAVIYLCSLISPPLPAPVGNALTAIPLLLILLAAMALSLRHRPPPGTPDPGAAIFASTAKTPSWADLPQCGYEPGGGR